MSVQDVPWEGARSPAFSPWLHFSCSYGFWSVGLSFVYIGKSLTHRIQGGTSWLSHNLNFIRDELAFRELKLHCSLNLSTDFF